MTGGEPLLTAEVAVRRGTFALDVSLAVPAGGVLAVVGPNGAGKTTTLRCLAGLTPLHGGRVVLGGTVLDDPSARTFVPPAARWVGVVFQDYRLFPRMSVLDNVAFGLRARGTARRAADAVAADWLYRVGLGAAAAARPGTLSGGQAQRVALARALAPGPDLLLLDEPFAALDAQARLDLRGELAEHLGSFRGVTVLVTHDPNDALALADRVVVLEAGRIVDAGAARDVAGRPRSRFVARLVGTNLLTGRVDGGVARFDGFGDSGDSGDSRGAGGVGGVGGVAAPGLADGPVLGTVAPRDVELAAEAPGHPARVRRIEARPGGVRAYLTGPELVADVDGDPGGWLVAGAAVRVRLRAGAVAVYRPDRG